MKKYLLILITAQVIIFSSCGNEANINTQNENDIALEEDKISENETEVENVDYVTSIVEIGDFANYSFNSLLANEGLYTIKNSEGNVGFINSEGEIVIEPKYIGAMPFSDGLAFVVDQDNGRYYIDANENIVIDNADGLNLAMGD